MTEFEELVQTLRGELGGEGWNGVGTSDGFVVLATPTRVHRWGPPPAAPDHGARQLTCPECGRTSEIEGKKRRYCTGPTSTGLATHPPTEMA